MKDPYLQKCGEVLVTRKLPLKVILTLLKKHQDQSRLLHVPADQIGKVSMKTQHTKRDLDILTNRVYLVVFNNFPAFFLQQ